MFLKRLEINGFKSLADRTELLFNQHLTCIVGPNGSGKSNIADAVRWVLGEQSSKLLRGKKAEDVIFAGSSSRPKLGLAEVTLTLDNPSPTEEIPQAEISITRRVYRDGESEYLINQEKVRLQDVSALLTKLRCGQKSYAVIGQGMIDSVIVASPKEREEFFQEATGVRALQLKRDQSINRLDKTNDELARLQLVVSELWPRLRILRKQRERLAEREKLVVELAAAREQYFSQARAFLLSEISLAEKTKQQHEKKLADLRLALADSVAQEKLIWSKDPASNSKQTFEKLQAAQSNVRKLEIAWAETWKQEQKTLTATGQEALAQATEEKNILSAGLSAAREELAQTESEYNKYLKDLNWLEEEMAVVEAALQQAFSQPEKASKIGINWSETIDAVLRVLNQALKENNLSLVNEAVALLQAARPAQIPPSDSETMEKKSSVDFESLRLKSQNLREQVSNIQKILGRLEQGKEYAKAKVEAATKEFARIEGHLEYLKQNQSETVNRQKAQARLVEAQSKHEADLAQAKAVVAQIERDLAGSEADRSVWQAEYLAAQQATRSWQLKIEAEEKALQPIAENLTRHRVRLEDLDQAAKEFFAPDHPIFVSALPAVTNQEVIAESERQMKKLDQRLAQVGDIDPGVVAEQEKAEQEYTFLTTQLDDLRQAEQELRKLVAELDRQIEVLFHQGFAIINKSFGLFFQTLFNGGQAKLILTEPEPSNADEAESGMIEGETAPIAKRRGIEIQAVPPGKKNQGLEALSGGEKALTAIALIAAIISNNPAPFVLLDEVDAALDEANAERYAQIIKTLQQKSQIIAITHNRATMHQADTLYGVTMSGDGVSKLLSVSLKEIEGR